MHVAKRKRVNITRGRSIAGKVAVLGLLDRHGKTACRRFALRFSPASAKTLAGRHSSACGD
jgi:hypothetical protein